MYNKDNIEGIIFGSKRWSEHYKVGKNVSNEYCLLEQINNNWNSTSYPINDIVSNLNSGIYIVIDSVNKIHECW